MVTEYASLVARQEQVPSDLTGKHSYPRSQVRNVLGLDAVIAKYFVESEQCDRILLPLLQALKSDG